MDERFLSLLLVAAVASSAPLLFTAVGELISETAGVINIELEAMMLCGALGGVLGGHLTGDPVLGFVFAALCGAVVAVVHGFASLTFGANQVVSGVALNILALGLTTFVLATLLSGVTGAVAGVPVVTIPVLVELPVLGPALFRQNVMVYVAYGLVPATWYILTRTAVGLMLRAAGERPEAADSLGVDVVKVRWAALLMCGVLAGIGGGLLALAGLGFFTQNLTAGRGFIALAAVVFGRWRPFGTAMAVLLFATAEAFQIRAQALGFEVPYQLLVALPYLVTLVALAGVLKRMRPPAALGMNFVRE